MSVKRRKSEWVTIHLPIDLILKCYAVCIDQRITFDQFVKNAIDNYEKIYLKDKNEKVDK